MIHIIQYGAGAFGLAFLVHLVYLSIRSYSKTVTTGKPVVKQLRSYILARLSRKLPLDSRNKAGNNKTNVSKPKQVHFATAVSVSSGDLMISSSNNKLKQAETSVSHTSNTQKASIKKTTSQPAPTTTASSTNEFNKLQQAEINGNEYEAATNEPVASHEAFGATKMGTSNGGGGGSGSSKRKQTARQSKTIANTNVRKRHSSDSNQTSYSSEQLFKIIAASSLSRCEVEMAVETLLDKLESGESDWQKPKNDPVHRLKNQLRDSEAALATEIQNHEQTRARLVELKTQFQNERSTRSSISEKLINANNDLLSTSAALKQVHGELSKQRMLTDKTRDESAKVISGLEENNVRLQNLLANSNVHHDELNKLRHEFNENVEQLQRYEAANDSLKKRVHDLESNLRATDVQLDRLRSDKQHDDYEACAKISELESDRLALEKALKDHIVHMNELSETNKLLDKSLNETQIAIAQKDDALKRLQEEKHINETSMKRALTEMEMELRKLHEQLSSKLATSDERFRMELNQFEQELTNAGQREQRLNSKMKQLRDGLSELFPDLKKNPSIETNSDDWVHQYLIALKQLTATVDELRQTKCISNNQGHDENGGNRSFINSPTKRSMKSYSSLSHMNGNSSRVGSPTINGRSSRASTNRDHDKKLIETKLVEKHAQQHQGWLMNLSMLSQKILSKWCRFENIHLIETRAFQPQFVTDYLQFTLK